MQHVRELSLFSYAYTQQEEMQSVSANRVCSLRTPFALPNALSLLERLQTGDRERVSVYLAAAAAVLVHIFFELRNMASRNIAAGTPRLLPTMSRGRSTATRAACGSTSSG